MANICILDVQGFHVNRNEFIAKEVAVLCGLRQQYAHFVFLPPRNVYPDFKCQQFVENYIHGLEWNSGFVPYEQLQSVLQVVTKDNIEIYVKGHEKMKYVQSLLKDKRIINLEAFDCPSLNSMKINNEFQCNGIYNNYVKCFFHKSPVLNCSLLNVMMLSSWWKNNMCV